MFDNRRAQVSDLIGLMACHPALIGALVPASSSGNSGASARPCRGGAAHAHPPRGSSAEEPGIKHSRPNG